MRAKTNQLEAWYDGELQAWIHNVQYDYLASPISSRSISISFIDGEPVLANVVAHGSWIDYNLSDQNDRKLFVNDYGNIIDEAKQAVDKDIKKRI